MCRLCYVSFSVLIIVGTGHMGFLPYCPNSNQFDIKTYQAVCLLNTTKPDELIIVKNGSLGASP
jgi:hypothetical protein